MGAARLLLIGVVLSTSTGVHAQSAAMPDAPDPVALALFRKGRDLVAGGEWEAGCEKLTQSLARYPSASTILNLARCDEHQGKVASAWARHHQAIPLAETVADPTRRDELLGLARAGILALEPRLSILRVSVRAPATGVRLVDEVGRPVPVGEDVPLDPGPHSVRAMAAGYREQSYDFHLSEGTTTPLSIVLEVLTPSAAPAIVGPPRVDVVPAIPPAEPHPFPWLGVGLGVLGLSLGGVGVGFGVDAANASRTLEDRCGADLVCDEDLAFDPSSLNERKNRSLGMAIGFGSAGVVAIGVAVWVLVTAHKSPRKAMGLPAQFGRGIAF